MFHSLIGDLSPPLFFLSISYLSILTGAMMHFSLAPSFAALNWCGFWQPEVGKNTVWTGDKIIFNLTADKWNNDDDGVEQKNYEEDD